MRWSMWMQGVGLIVLAVVLALLVQSGGRGAWFSSPLSPLAPGDVPTEPVVQSLPTGPAISLLPVLAEGESRPPTFSLWTSFWFWLMLGLILFGGLAWGTALLLRRLKPRSG